jgi:hypothetical protein
MIQNNSLAARKPLLSWRFAGNAMARDLVPALGLLVGACAVLFLAGLLPS